MRYFIKRKYDGSSQMKEPFKDNLDFKELAFYSNLVFQLGITIVGCITVGGGIGFFLDRLLFKKIGLFFIVGLVLGVLSGFVTIYRMILKKEPPREDDATQ